MRQVHIASEKLFVDYAGSTVPITDAATGEITQALGSYPRQNGLAVALRELGPSNARCSSWTGCKAWSCVDGFTPA